MTLWSEMPQSRSHILLDARLLAYRRGGISRYVTALMEWLPRVAPDMHISPFVNRSIKAPEPHVRVFTPPHHRLERTSLAVELNLHRPALIHSPDFIVPHTFGAKRIATVHDLNFLTHPDHLAPDSLRYYQQLESSLRETDHVIAVSHYTAGQLQEILRVAPQMITVIPNGVEIKERAKSDQTALKDLNGSNIQLPGDALSEDRPIILMVGTIEPRKRHALMLKAIGLMRQRSDARDAVLVVVGQSGWNCKDIVEQVRSATRSRAAVWLPDADNDALAALYQRAIVVVVPSLDEGFGLTLLEGMAAGAPVVAASRGALPDIAGEAALLIDDDEPEAWAVALATLINDDEKRSKMSEMGLKRARQFSWEATARMTADLYRRVLPS